ncbi:MAG: hypothetical protein LH474_04410 [Chamaesiphon sp.]|nr:hypothetical protein [Chamaesiphon sp.]
MTLLPDLSQEPTHHHGRDLDALSRLETFLYLTPVVGLLPSMWAIYRCQRNKRQLAVCRLSVLLAFTWLSIYLSLNVGADLSGASAVGFRLLFLNSLATSGYFMASVWLMVLLWQKKSLRLPGFSILAERTIQ